MLSDFTISVPVTVTLLLANLPFASYVYEVVVFAILSSLEIALPSSLYFTSAVTSPVFVFFTIAELLICFPAALVLYVYSVVRLFILSFCVATLPFVSYVYSYVTVFVAVSFDTADFLTSFPVESV